MENDILKRIDSRLKALELTVSGAAEKAGLGRETLRKAFERGNIPTYKTLQKLAPVLQATPEWLQNGDGASLKQESETRLANVELPDFSRLDRDVPVMGVAAGSHEHGAFLLEENVVDNVFRPPALKNVKNLYALYAVGSSMEPLYKAGDLLLIHPDKPPRNGDGVVVQFKKNEGDDFEAIIAILHKQCADGVELQKLNPPAIIKFDKNQMKSIHRILTMNEVIGV